MTQILVNGVIAGSVYALVGLSLALAYAPTRFFNFAQGAVYTAAAYAALFGARNLGLSLPAGVLLAVVVSVALGTGMHLAVYNVLLRRGSPAPVLMLASLGLYIAIQNTISLLFGDQVSSLSSGRVKEGLDLLQARITPAQLAIAAACIAAFLLVLVLLRYTRFGKAFRAVASDPELALVRGIDAHRTTVLSIILGSAIIGLTGVLCALDVDITPTMGLNAFMMGIVAMIAGGTKRLTGILIGGLALGLVQQLGVWSLGSQWQDAIAFAALVIFLLARPQGVSGVSSSRSLS